MTSEQKVIKIFEESASLKVAFAKSSAGVVVEVSRLIAEALNDGKKLLLFGNRGSATDASHIAAEFVNRFKFERPPLPAIALNTDMAILTAIANDYDYSDVFSKQIKALAQEGDIVIALSTSGGSQNVLRAVETAKKKKLKVVVFTGAKGEKLASKAHYAFVVPSENTPRIQEVHITIGHTICQLVEEILFEAPAKRQ